jgi:hypothetical protein
VGLNIFPGFVNVLNIDGDSLCADEDSQRPDEVDIDFSQD